VPKGDQGRGREGLEPNPLGSRELLGGDSRVRLRQGLLDPPATQQRLHQAQPQRGVRVQVVGAGEQLTADRLGVGETTGPHQADRLLGQQPVAGRVGRPGQLQGPPQQFHRHRRRAGCGLAGRPLQPRYGLGVARRRAPDQLLGDLLGWRPRPGQRPAGVQVQAPSHRHRQVLVQRLPDKIVAEPQQLGPLLQDARGHGLLQRGQEPDGRPARHQREVGDGEVRAKNRRDPQQIQRRRGEEAQPMQDEQRQGRWDADGGQLGRAIGPELDRAATLQRADQLGDKQWVAARPLDLPQEAGAGRGADQPLDQAGHGHGIERPQHQLGRPGRAQPSKAPFQRCGSGNRAGRTHQQQRELLDPPAEPMQHQQRRRISPLQVLHHQHDRVLGAERLDHCDESLHDPELGLGCVRQPSSAWAGARVLPEQRGNRGSPAPGGRGAGGQAVGDHAERAPLFQLVPGTLENPEAEPVGVGEPFGDDAGLPDPSLANHQQRPTCAVSDLSRRRP
jgi:hypothetical protein